MRLRVWLDNPHETGLPVNHQHLLTGLVYRLLASSDVEYARFLHDQGYAAADDVARRFKLFVFSTLRARQRRVVGDTLWLAPGPVEWLVSSPVAAFLTHGATGLLAVGEALVVGPARFAVRQVETVPAPVFAQTTRFTCLTPIVAAVPQADGRTRYLRPCEGAAFGEAVWRNLLRKHALVSGGPPPDERLRLEFDADYLARNPNNGTKKITYKDIDVVGALAPFTLHGSPELMQLAWECGLGEKNAGGFGMIDVTKGGAPS